MNWRDTPDGQVISEPCNRFDGMTILEALDLIRKEELLKIGRNKLTPLNDFYFANESYHKELALLPLQRGIPSP